MRNPYDKIESTFPNSVTTVYTYSLAGAVVGIVTIVYTDSSKSATQSIEFQPDQWQSVFADDLELFARSLGSVSIYGAVNSHGEVWDIGLLDWVPMQQPILNAGSVTIPAGITVNSSALPTGAATEATLQSVAGFNIPKCDEVAVTYPTGTTEVYTYKLATVTVGILTVTFSDATKTVLTGVVKS